MKVTAVVLRADTRVSEWDTGMPSGDLPLFDARALFSTVLSSDRALAMSCECCSPFAPPTAVTPALCPRTSNTLIEASKIVLTSASALSFPPLSCWRMVANAPIDSQHERNTLRQLLTSSISIFLTPACWRRSCK
eukprot:440322-Rhodomonas_salina.1